MSYRNGRPHFGKEFATEIRIYRLAIHIANGSDISEGGGYTPQFIGIRLLRNRVNS